MVKLFYTHAWFMSLGFLFLLSGFIIVRFMKGKPWWFKIHRLCGIVGASCVIIAFFAGSLFLSLVGNPHLRVPHSYIGIIAIILAVGTVFLGFMQFRFRQSVATIRRFHAWSGRIAILLMLINILLGFSMIGIL